MRSTCDYGSMRPNPEGTFPVFPLVVLLAGTSSYKLYRSWNRRSITVISHEQVHVIRSYHLVQYSISLLLPCVSKISLFLPP